MGFNWFPQSLCYSFLELVHYTESEGYSFRVLHSWGGVCCWDWLFTRMFNPRLSKFCFMKVEFPCSKYRDRLSYTWSFRSSEIFCVCWSHTNKHIFSFSHAQLLHGSFPAGLLRDALVNIVHALDWSKLIDIIKSKKLPQFQHYLMIANRFCYVVKFNGCVSWEIHGLYVFVLLYWTGY